MDNLTQEEQKIIINDFKNWLSGPTRLGKEPAEIELDKTFEHNGYRYAIIKFKTHENSAWLFGVKNIIANGKEDKIVYTEFEEFDQESAQSKCTNYIDKYKQEMQQVIKNFAEQNPLAEIIKLEKENNTQAIIDYVDQNIDKFIQPKEKDGKPCYQYSFFDGFYFESVFHRDFYRAEENIELQMLMRKAMAYFHLQNYVQSEKILEQAHSLAPNSAFIYLEKFKVAYMQNNYVKCKQILDEMYLYTWNAAYFAEYLRDRGFLAEKDDWQTAINYFAVSVKFDNSKQAFDQINDHLKFISIFHKLGGVPTQPEVYDARQELLSEGLECRPAQYNMDFCGFLYNWTLAKGYSEQVNQFAKDNLSHMTNPLDAKSVEVVVLTPNKLVVSRNHFFNFQVNQDYEVVENTDPTTTLIYTIKSKLGEIKIHQSADAKTQQDFDFALQKNKQNFVNLGFIIEAEEAVETGKQKAYKIYTKNAKGEHYVIFWFKLNPVSMGRISAKVEENNSALETEITEILGSWDN